MLGRVKSKIWAVVLVAFMPLCRHFFSEDSEGYEVGRVSAMNAQPRTHEASCRPRASECALISPVALATKCDGDCYLNLAAEVFLLVVGALNWSATC